MKTFHVEAVEIKAPFEKTFGYIANAQNLPEWTSAFKEVSEGRALMQTPNGLVEIALTVNASHGQGTIDWVITFPDGSVATAYSRVVDAGKDCSIYSFILIEPPAALEQLEGTLEQQSELLRDELARLSAILAERES